MEPVSVSEPGERAGFARRSIEKSYHGPLAATGLGEMLTQLTESTGGLSYMALERVSGVLEGRSGSFVLEHSGSMCGAADVNLSVRIVPHSGTEQLEGLSGTLAIEVIDGVHYYHLDYNIPRSVPASVS